MRKQSQLLVERGKQSAEHSPLGLEARGGKVGCTINEEQQKQDGHLLLKILSDFYPLLVTFSQPYFNLSYHSYES